MGATFGCCLFPNAEALFRMYVQEAGRETIGKRKLATDVIYYIPTNTVFENTSQEVSCSGKIQEIFFVGLSCAVIIREHGHECRSK